MNKKKEMKLLKYRIICCSAAALLGIGGLICFTFPKGEKGTDDASTPSVSANPPFNLSENISPPILSINEAPLPLDNQETFPDNSYLQETPSYTDTKENEALVMTASDRYTYQEGFFYQSLTDDIKNRINGLPINQIVPCPTKSFAMSLFCMKISTEKPGLAKLSATRQSPGIW